MLGQMDPQVPATIEKPNWRIVWQNARQFALSGLILLAGQIAESRLLGQDSPSSPSADAKAEAAPTKTPGPTTADVSKGVEETLALIEKHYVKDVGRQELLEAALRGMVSRLDSYSEYLSPDEVRLLKEAIAAEYAGVGLQIGLVDQRWTILSPRWNTSAYRAGLRAGDRILQIEGKDASNLSSEELQNRLSGEAGTTLKLLVMRAGASEAQVIEITREWIPLESILGDHRDENDRWNFWLPGEDKLAYIRIASFGKNTPDELRTACAELVSQGLRGLILDLRNNPGGLLPSAVDICDLFVEQGKIVSIAGRSSPEHVWNAKAEGTFTGFPVVVLINRYSASSSEIVAACLQDSQRAEIIGERSWGKGSVQNLIELPEGRGAVKLTTSLYQRPSGKNIHRFDGANLDEEWGVIPSPGREVVLTDEENRRIMAERRVADRIYRKDQKPAEQPDFRKLDRQLEKGVQVLLEKLAPSPGKK